MSAVKPGRRFSRLPGFLVWAPTGLLSLSLLVCAGRLCVSRRYRRRRQGPIRGENSGLPSIRQGAISPIKKTEVTQATLKPNDTRSLDTLTGGAFSAPTSGERAARVREWLSGNPSVEQMQEVFRELSGRDKGAAKLLREKLDEIKRSRGQEAIAAEWAEKAQGLLAQAKLNIADAMAWQRDAAKAGAPLSREPLATMKAQLADRIKGIEDLQHRVQVQREAAVLLAQRIEVLSTKSWRDAQAAAQALATDVPDWQAQAQALLADPNWISVDTKFPPLLDASRNQLQAVWEAFQSALAQAVAAASDPSAPLPPVPVWADELRMARGVAVEVPSKPAKPKGRSRAARAGDAGRARGPGKAGAGDRARTWQSQCGRGHGTAQCAQGTRQADRRQAGKPGPCRAGGGRRAGRLAALAGRPVASGTGRQGRGFVRTHGAGGRSGTPAAQAALRRPQDAGATSRPARPMEADRSGRRAESRVVEALRRCVQRGLQGGGSLARQGQGRGRRTQGPAPGADRGTQGLGERQPDGPGRRLEGIQPDPAPVRHALARCGASEREGVC